MKDEHYWLIEIGNLCVGVCNNKRKLVTFTDPNALRFKSKRDAQDHIERFYINGAVARDHLFVAPAETAEKVNSK
jgi:hypothetical protein